MLHMDMEPLAALRIYYNGEKLGVWSGDIHKAEKSRTGIFGPRPVSSCGAICARKSSN